MINQIMPSSPLQRFAAVVLQVVIPNFLAGEILNWEERRARTADPSGYRKRAWLCYSNLLLRDGGMGRGEGEGGGIKFSSLVSRECVHQVCVQL